MKLHTISPAALAFATAPPLIADDSAVEKYLRK
jgi:hypothetical protein